MLIFLVFLLITACAPLHCADGLPPHVREELGCPPQMPVQPFRCFDAFGKEVPCIEEMDCHEEPKGKEL